MEGEAGVSLNVLTLSAAALSSDSKFVVLGR